MPHTPPPKTYRVTSFGCQMNVYDGERMAELLSQQGISPANEGDDADLVVLNTCHIREKAVERIYSNIGRLTRKDGSAPLIAVAGCVAQAEGREIMKRAPTVKMVVGPQAYHHLPEMLAEAIEGGRPVNTDMPAQAKFDALPARRKVGASAFLTVQEGCDKFCTYCVVPYTRGAEISRPFNDLIAEAQRLVEAGAREITLLGQNVNAWSGEDGKGRAIGLAGLIRALAMLPDLVRIRYTTSHPNDMNDALIAAHVDVEKLMPYLHLPVQSGSDRILKAMNRSHSRDSYLRLIEKVRTARPDIALSGDFIVGFPGETDAEFRDTLSIIAEAKYAAAFSFKYSPRPGTPAAEMPDQIAVDLMDERLQELQATITASSLSFNNSSVGKTCDVLVERKGRQDGQWLGKSPWLQSVHFTAPNVAIGDLVRVELMAALPNSLSGRLIA